MLLYPVADFARGVAGGTNWFNLLFAALVLPGACLSPVRPCGLTSGLKLCGSSSGCFRQEARQLRTAALMANRRLAICCQWCRMCCGCTQSSPKLPILRGPDKCGMRLCSGSAVRRGQHVGWSDVCWHRPSLSAPCSI
eukprot:s4116_g5.t1